MRIVFLSRLFFPHIGGVEKHVMEVSTELIRQGHDVTVITERFSSNSPRPNEPHPDPLQRGEDASKNSLEVKEMLERVHVYRISVGGDDWFKKFRIWKEIWRLRKVWQAADVIHAHDVFFWYLPFRFIYLHKKVYTTFHGYETIFPVSEKAKLVRKISEKLSAGNICVGDFIKKWYGTHPTFVTYGGINKTQIAKRKLQNYNSNLKITFIGRLDADTGFVFYQQVLHLLHTKDIRFTLDIYGDGELRKSAEKIGNVHGFIPSIHQEIQKADIIFASSYLSVLDAMIEHKPVFSTYSNPLKKDYLTMAPFAKFICIENNPEEMADKIASYVKNPQGEKERIEKAYTWASLQTWKKLTNTYLRLWNR